MDFEGFTSVDFSTKSDVGFVYVLCCLDKESEIPFYVGQTQSIWGRLDDYHWADFQASTDFRVGEAAKYLRAKNLRIVAKYKASAERRIEEGEIIDALHKEGRRLLNDCPGYHYKTAIPEAERAKVQQCVEDILRSPIP